MRWRKTCEYKTVRQFNFVSGKKRPKIKLSNNHRLFLKMRWTVRLQNGFTNCQTAKIGNSTKLYFASFVSAILERAKKPKNERFR
jgi:hypothetical protein